MNEPKSLSTITTKQSVSLKPKLRFKEFDGDWEKKTLGEVSKISSGGTPSRNTPIFWNGNIYWVTTSLIDFNTIYESEEKITEEALKKSSAKLFPIGTILMAMYGQGKTRGKVAKLGMEATTNQACAAIMVKNNINKDYLFQNLAGRYDEIRELSNEGGQQNLSGGIIKEIKITFPQLPEQQKIATFLTAIDCKLQQLNTKKNLLEQYKKGVMQQLFSQKLRFKDDDGKNYGGWEVKRLGDLGKVVSGLTYSPNDIVDAENGVLVLRSSNVQDRKLSFHDNVYVKVDNFNPVQKEDVLICVRNGSKRLIGKNAIIDENSEGIAFGAFMTIYRSKYNNFLFHYFGSEEYNKEVHKNLGATINSINGSDLKKFKVPFPGVKEQKKFANYLSSIESKIETITQQIDKTQAFKKGLLQQMFV
ncbi:restriction endonuclease subunit S [Gelidibacter gilvus]|uniref:Restriction endonuclease subunit S n=1 Tax=Gelidibacter gilvus TaxID=59602 RepID=A0A4Q0XH79_9FLAO|nr:restriction endonuclease subunit S [Gelidibacter gilvus]RXJ50227.1 restriction endonuclease subunit S [Gelidibacter gilvus]